jgi:hypothetical protein
VHFLSLGSNGKTTEDVVYFLRKPEEEMAKHTTTPESISLASYWS